MLISLKWEALISFMILLSSFIEYENHESNTEYNVYYAFDNLYNNKATIDSIMTNKSNIELLAIGIGHDVTRYYNQAVKITDVQDLGDVMINQLTDLFVEKNKKTIH